MIYQEIVTEVENLPLDEQLALMETSARSISRRAFQRSAPKTSLEPERGMCNPPPGEPMPTDDDLLEERTRFFAIGQKSPVFLTNI